MSKIQADFLGLVRQHLLAVFEDFESQYKSSLHERIAIDTDVMCQSLESDVNGELELLSLAVRAALESDNNKNNCLVTGVGRGRAYFAWMHACGDKYPHTFRCFILLNYCRYCLAAAHGMQMPSLTALGGSSNADSLS